MITRRYYYQQGFTLLEVMISALVLSVGLLGLAGLQGVSLKMSQGSYLRVQAVNLAYEITDSMRANKANAASYDGTVTATCNTALAYSWSSDIADSDLTLWGNRLACLLPGGSGTIVSTVGNPFVTVTITWNETRLGGSDTQSFSLTTEL